MATEIDDDPEAIPDPTKPAAKVTKKKKGPGRPPKFRVAVEAPKEVVQYVATAPLIGVAVLVHKLFGRKLRYSKDAMENTAQAFDAWLQSFNVQLTPGWAYLACIPLAILSGVEGMELDPEHPRVKAMVAAQLAQERERAAAEQAAKAAAAAAAPVATVPDQKQESAHAPGADDGRSAPATAA